uniref:Fibronectin type-III domain-containing protein n=1 Tax=Amphimedon queenslandica TaxID=400682 RepID=A0A1X7SYV8_AMPQE
MIIIIFILLSSSVYASSSSTVLSFNQSSPSYDIVCSGDTLVFTCITSGGGVVWRINNGDIRIISASDKNKTDQIDSFMLAITDTNANNTITSTATSESVPSQLNGTVIDCSVDGIYFNTLTVHIAGVPVSVINIKIIPINNNTVLMNWYYEKNDEVHCIQYYNITIISDDNINGHMISNESSATIPSLIIGTNYSFIIIPIDTIGREGPPSSLIQYIWNVPAQVVNISWDQISTDTITIWWNNNEDVTLHYPPVHYIVSVHNITINTTDTNVTINGLYPNDEYTVYIKPVNAIGEGPLINIIVNITEQQSNSKQSTSTNVPVSVTESLSDAITSSNNMTASIFLSIIDVTSTIMSDTPSTITSSVQLSTATSCNLTCTGSIISSVAIAVPITGLLTGLIASIITSIIVYCIMKNKGNTLRERSPVDIGPIYDLPTINNEQQEQVIDTTPNTAYGQI